MNVIEALKDLSLLGASPLFPDLATHDAGDLGNGMRVATYPCRPASIRGLRARVILLDELAFFRNGEGFAVDVEMLRSARAALATTGGEFVIVS